MGNPTTALTSGIIYMHEGQFEDALRCLKNKDAESPDTLAMAIQALLQINRVDVASKELSKMKDIDDDSTITKLAESWVQMGKGGDNLNEAFFNYDELVQKYGDTPLLLNGQVGALPAPPVVSQESGYMCAQVFRKRVCLCVCRGGVTPLAGASSHRQQVSTSVQCEPAVRPTLGRLSVRLAPGALGRPAPPLGSPLGVIGPLPGFDSQGPGFLAILFPCWGGVDAARTSTLQYLLPQGQRPASEIPSTPFPCVPIPCSILPPHALWHRSRADLRDPLSLSFLRRVR